MDKESKNWEKQYQDNNLFEKVQKTTNSNLNLIKNDYNKTDEDKEENMLNKKCKIILSIDRFKYCN